MLCVFPLLSRRVVLVLEEGITFLTLEHFGQPGSGLPPVERLGQAHGGKRGRYGAPAHEAEERSEVSRGCEARHEQSSQARLEVIVQYRQPVGELQVVYHAREVGDLSHVRLVASRYDDVVHHEALPGREPYLDLPAGDLPTLFHRGVRPAVDGWFFQAGGEPRLQLQPALGPEPLGDRLAFFGGKVPEPARRACCRARKPSASRPRAARYRRSWRTRPWPTRTAPITRSGTWARLSLSSTAADLRI